MKYNTFENIIKTITVEADINKNRNIILLLCGNSGSGKSTFESKLVRKNSNLFFKLPQCTTREKRPYEKPYDYFFINKETYGLLKDKLIAKIQGKSFNGTCYGTIPAFSKGKINTCVASYEAIDDIVKMYDDNDPLIKNSIIYTLLFDVDYEHLKSKREGRDKNFIIKEQTELVKSLNNAYDKKVIRDIGYWRFEDNGFRFPEMHDVNLKD